MIRVYTIEGNHQFAGAEVYSLDEHLFLNIYLHSEDTVPIATFRQWSAVSKDKN